MAIPIRVTITCPNCGVSEDVTFADTSIGPAGRVSDSPIYSMFQNDLWPQTKVKENGNKITYISCASCKESNFTTLQDLARTPFRGAPSNSSKKPRLSDTPGSGPQNMSKPISRN